MQARGFQHWASGQEGCSSFHSPPFHLFPALFVQCFCLPHNSPIFLFLLLPSTDPRPSLHSYLTEMEILFKNYFQRPCFLYSPLYLKAIDIYPQLLYIPGDLCSCKLCISLSKEALHATSEDCSLKHVLLWHLENSFPCCYLWWL